jgi:hypothetical protein
MSLGLSSGTGAFSSYIKMDARSGRILRRKNAEKGEQADVDITDGFQAVFDLSNIKVGWAMFVAGAAPSYIMSKIGEPRQPRPGDSYKEGFLMNVALPAQLGGGVHEFSSTAKAVIQAIDKLHTEYQAAPEAASGKVPVVKMTGTTMVESKMPNGQTTRNFQPVLAVVGWVDPPPSLATPAPAQAVPASAFTTPPSTGSTVVPPPAAKPAAAPADMAFG